MAYAWMRQLTVELTSKKTKKKLVFGEKWKEGKEDLYIDVEVNKFASSLKDSATIKISNLSYTEIVTIINGQYYDVEIKCGYRTMSAMTIFKGGVIYISNNLGNKKDTNLIILCGSELVAKYGQSRINLTLNSGINLYTALNIVSKKSGILNANISKQLKRIYLTEISNSKNATSWIDELAKSNQNILTNSDASSTATFSIYDVMRGGGRKIALTNDKIQLSGGYPKLTKDGVSFTLFPTFNFMPGDTVKIDNSILDISVNNANSSEYNKGYYIDEDGEYVVFEITYNLCNRESEFSCTLNCKSRKLLSYVIEE